jgi:hypothetical protein
MMHDGDKGNRVGKSALANGSGYSMTKVCGGLRAEAEICLHFGSKCQWAL